MTTAVHTAADLIRAAGEALIRRDTLAVEDLIRTSAGWLQTRDETEAQQTLLRAILEAACLLEGEPSELADEIERERVTRAAARQTPRSTAMPKPAAMTLAEIEALIAAIARQDIGVETLETRNSDGLDFHEVAVWSLREALMKAFHAGRATAGQ